MKARTIITLHKEGDIFVLCQAGNVFFYLVPSSEETSFLTIFYSLYFSHHYTHITHYMYCTLGSWQCMDLIYHIINSNSSLCSRILSPTE